MTDKKVTYEDHMKKLSDNLVEHGKFEKATGHVSFDAEKLELPKHITGESIKQHVGYFNDLGVAVEEATSVITRKERANNEDLVTVDGTLNLHGVNFNSQHFLKQSVGETTSYGSSITAIDYIHSDENAAYRSSLMERNVDLAEKLFK